jgi:hypothetical protein
MVNNIAICTQNNAIVQGHVVNIVVDSEEKLPLCDISVYTPAFDSWNYSTSKNTYNLLKQSVRSSIIKKVGESICGSLLNGNVDRIAGAEFFSKSFENSVSETTTSFKEEKIKIEQNNGRIDATEDGSRLFSTLKNSRSTKGVYWTGTGAGPEKLIELLHSRYSSSDYKYLTVDNANIQDANVYLTNDEDGIVFALVDTETYV